MPRPASVTNTIKTSPRPMPRPTTMMERVASKMKDRISANAALLGPRATKQPVEKTFIQTGTSRSGGKPKTSGYKSGGLVTKNVSCKPCKMC